MKTRGTTSLLSNLSSGTREAPGVDAFAYLRDVLFRVLYHAAADIEPKRSCSRRGDRARLRNHQPGGSS